MSAIVDGQVGVSEDRCNIASVGAAWITWAEDEDRDFSRSGVGEREFVASISIFAYIYIYAANISRYTHMNLCIHIHQRRVAVG